MAHCGQRRRGDGAGEYLANFKDNIKTNKAIKCLIPKEIFEDKLNEDVLTGFNYIISELKRYKIDIEIKSLKYWKPDIHRKYLLKIVENEGALNLKTLLENERSNISKNLRNSLIYGKNIELLTLNNIKKELKELKNKVNAFFESYDLIIMPTTPQRAFEIKTDVPKNQANFTSLANICDLPSISLPYYYKGKLPYSLQLLAPNMNDHFLLRILNMAFRLSILFAIKILKLCTVNAFPLSRFAS